MSERKAEGLEGAVRPHCAQAPKPPVSVRRMLRSTLSNVSRQLQLKFLITGWSSRVICHCTDAKSFIHDVCGVFGIRRHIEAVVRRVQ